MTSKTLSRLAAALVLGCSALATQVYAVTQDVFFNRLNASATVLPLLAAGDTLFVDTLVTQETGALSQAVTFSLGSGLTLNGFAAWMITTAVGPGPRLIGVNIDIFDSANSLVVSDGGVVVSNGFATSSFASVLLGAGTYKLVATGTGVRASSLDIGLSFANPVPEPETYALMLAGLATLGYMVRRRKRN